jgi:hypothetical protein
MTMRADDPHCSYEDLLLAADAELPPAKAESVRSHVASCWTCRTRMREIEEAIADYVHVRESSAAALPPADGPRAVLKARMADLAAAPPRHRLARYSRALALAGVGLLAALVGIIALRSGPVETVEVRSIPDPRITPGAILPVTREDVCGEGAVEGVRIVTPAVAKQVFAAYGIDSPAPRAYEVDYLITPALGGSDNIRNFWPQSYANTIWNAHTKDALEDHLRGLVCAGRIELSTAQQDIARDWIAAYKKYFHTERPLPEHFSFLKDRPWEE